MFVQKLEFEFQSGNVPGKALFDLALSIDVALFVCCILILPHPFYLDFFQGERAFFDGELENEKEGNVAPTTDSVGLCEVSLLCLNLLIRPFKVVSLSQQCTKCYFIF